MSHGSPFGDRVWTIAHRGASRDCRENTIAAFDEALLQGCDAIELDLQLTRDDVVVVFHNRTLVKIGGGRSRIRSLDHAQLAELEVPVPTLTDVLERYARRTHLLLEIKRTHDVEQLKRLSRATVELVVRHASADRVFILSFDQTALDEVARCNTGLRRVLNISHRIGSSPPLPSSSMGLFAASVDLRALRHTIVAEFGRSGLPLFVFTCNRRGEAERALEAGAVGIMSDRPAWLRHHLGNRATGR